MASAPYLKRDASGTFRIHWTENRIGKRISTRTKDLVRAKAVFAEWLSLERQAPADGAVTIGDCWKVYDREHVQKEIVEKGKAEYYWRLLDPVFGHLLVPQLSQMAIDDYSQKRTRDGVKPSTIRNELGYMLSAVKFCTVRPHKLLEPSLAADVITGLKLPEHGKPRDRWLRTDEIQKIMAAAAEGRTGGQLTRVELFLWLALETAARKQAILDLTWDRVHFDTGTIEFNMPERKETKKRRATVPISSALRPVLERAFAEREDKSRTDGLVMENKGAVWASIQLVVVRAGLAPKQKVGRSQKPKATGISPHVLRHTAATHMARRGVALWIIAQILGNTLAMVEKVYAKWQPAEMRAAIDKITNGELEAAE